MYCWNCGKEIDEKSVFCPSCGMKQAGGPQAPKEKRPGNMLPIICAGICVCALLGMLFLTVGNRKNSEPAVTEPARAALQETMAITKTETPAKTVVSMETTAPAKAESTVNPNSVAIPDLASFLNTKYTQDEWGYTHYVTCLINKTQEEEIVKEILDLLQEDRYQLKLMDTEETTENGKKCTNYTFQYTGTNDDIDWVYLKSGGKYHVKLTQKAYSDSQTALILYTFPEFQLEDPGSRSKVKVDTPSPDSDDPAPDPFDRKKCWACGGDGRCDNCGGSGQVREWLPGTRQYVQVRCTRCSGGQCRQCYGKGYK